MHAHDPPAAAKLALLKILLGWLPGYQRQGRYDEAFAGLHAAAPAKMSYIRQNVFLFNTTIP